MFIKADIVLTRLNLIIDIRIFGIHNQLCNYYRRPAKKRTSFSYLILIRTSSTTPIKTDSTIMSKNIYSAQFIFLFKIRDLLVSFIKNVMSNNTVFAIVMHHYVAPLVCR